jgi:hypothetical protein
MRNGIFLMDVCLSECSDRGTATVRACAGRHAAFITRRDQPVAQQYLTLSIVDFRPRELVTRPGLSSD